MDNKKWIVMVNNRIFFGLCFHGKEIIKASERVRLLWFIKKVRGKHFMYFPFL